MDEQDQPAGSLVETHAKLRIAELIGEIATLRATIALLRAQVAELKKATV